MKKIYTTILAALFITTIFNAQNTIFTENFGGNFAHLESLSTNSSGYNHTGTGDFTHKIINGQGALGSKCFGQLDSSGSSSASRDMQLFAGNTYEFKAHVKTIQSRLYVTLRINVGGTDVATSGITTANGVWEELSCTYTPVQDEMASFQFVKTQGQLANIDKIKIICTSCADQNYVFDFNDSKEGWISGGGCGLSLGNDAMNMNATGVSVTGRSGNLTSDLNLNASNYNRARVTFKTPYNSGGAGFGKLYFYNLTAGNAPFAAFNITRDPSNTSTFQTVEIDLSSTPISGAFSGSIARVGFRAPWGIASGDTCNIRKIELYNQLPPPSGNPVLVTYSVDINDYLASGATLAANGMRIAGNFGANGALSSGFTMPDWSPTDASCAMSDPDGDNVWTVTVNYGSLPVGTQQFYKFVNGDWGGDESVNDSLCGGAGGFGTDRFLVLPSNDSVVCYKWATCTTCGNSTTGNDLTLQGIIDFTVPAGGSSGKAIHLIANNNISDLSVYGIGVANNGGGTDSVEYVFPSISVNAGEEILLARDTVEMAMYFDSCYSNFHRIIQASSDISQNGDDAIELFHNGVVIETFGDINVDGSGEPWEYMDSWAYKLGPTIGTPGPTSFSGFDWSFGVVNCTDGSTTTQSSSCPYPFCSGGNPPPPASTYDVTLKVNTATIYQTGGMVGPNGMYAGGGFLGGANGLQLVQSTTDTLIWSAVTTVVSGSSSNYYAFFNSPSSGSDWGTKENLNGLPCGDPANFNDRLLPNIMSDTTIQHCFGSCETDGSCPPPPSSFVNITFTLNVSSIISTGGTIDSTGMFIAGGGAFGNPGDNPMTDLGGGIWSFTISKPIGFSSDYTFTNGNSGWGAKENISGLPCAVPPYDDRNLAPVYSDTTIQHCFGTCDYDGTCNSIVTPPTGTNVTFQVDMSEVTDPFTAAELNGTFNGWCGNCDAMSDVDGDNVWDVTVSLTPGDSVEYKYSADSWAIQEMNDPGAPCTNGDSTYTNRVLVIPGSDTILAVVCWASCDPCVVVPPTGISDRTDNVRIYPNPANNILNISSSEIIQKVEVLDVVGRVIASKTLNSSNYILDVSNLNSNVYFVNYSINGVITTKKVIVNN